MSLYSERHGLREPLEKTYSINADMYLLLLNCCEKYYKNLTHLFPLDCYDNFTNEGYIVFNEKGFTTRMKIRIPSLYRDEFGNIGRPEKFADYDQYALLDLIEFFAQNIRDISEPWNSKMHQNYKTIHSFDSSNIFETFHMEINELFAESGLLYQLTNEKIIERVVENSTLTPEIEDSFKSVQEEGVKELLEDSIALYKTPRLTARQDSVEKMWDALERLKTYYHHEGLEKKNSIKKIINDMSNEKDYFVTLFDDEFIALTDIGNDCRIRHHETNTNEIDDDRYYDYFFNRCLSLIALAVQYLD